jgi:hypothetical protein
MQTPGIMGSSGSLNAQVLLVLTGQLCGKVDFQPQQTKFLPWQYHGAHQGDDYAVTLTLGKPDLVRISGHGHLLPAEPLIDWCCLES